MKMVSVNDAVTFAAQNLNVYVPPSNITFFVFCHRRCVICCIFIYFCCCITKFGLFCDYFGYWAKCRPFTYLFKFGNWVERLEQNGLCIFNGG